VQWQERNGGIPARRAVIRWAVRLLRREWKQQLLILALIAVAVGATVVASTVATDTPAPIAGVLGTAQDAASISGSGPATCCGRGRFPRARRWIPVSGGLPYRSRTTRWPLVTMRGSGPGRHAVPAR